jgi:DNA polymerase-3 subunit delta
MAIYTEDNLKKQIKERDFQRAYFIYGSEHYLKQHYVNLIVSKTVEKDFKDFNFHELDGKDVTLEVLADCVSTFPMMGEYTCTLIRDFRFPEYWIKQENNHYKLNEDLESILNDLPETTILIFWYDAIEVDDKDTRWSKSVKLIEKLGAAVKIDTRSPYSLAKLLVDSAPKKGCEIDKADATYLVNLVGTDYSTLRNEFDKVCAYTGSGKITRETIDKTVIISTEAKIFSLSRDIANGEADKAYSTLNNLFKLRVEPVVISATISKAFIDMYRASTIKEKGLKPLELLDIFPSYKRMDFIINNAVADGARYSNEQFHNAFDALAEADRKLKSTSQDGQLVLEELVLRLLRI